MVPYQKNQLHTELMSISSLLPFDGTISASRKQMAGNALTQTLVIKNPSERLIQTGQENKFGQKTFNVKVPVDCTVVRIIERYPRTVSVNSIRENPETIVIYEDMETKKIGCIYLTRSFSQHPHFGFKYQPRSKDGKIITWDELRTYLQPRTPLRKGQVLLESPSVNENGGYMFGKETNVAFMTHPAVAEDGFVISEEIAQDFAFTTTETRPVDFGSKSLPMNIYGTEENPKPFPDIGDYVREDGLLMVLRPHDDIVSPALQSTKFLGKDFVDHAFDERVYVPAGKGRVVDIRIMHDPSSVTPCTPPALAAQCAKYDDSNRRFYRSILDEYKRLEMRPEGVSITEEFHRLIVEALGVVGLGRPIMRNGRAINDSLIKQYRKAPLDDYRLIFVVEYENIPRVGNKFTCLHGGLDF